MKNIDINKYTKISLAASFAVFCLMSGYIIKKSLFTPMGQVSLENTKKETANPFLNEKSVSEMASVSNTVNSCLMVSNINETGKQQIESMIEANKTNLNGISYTPMVLPPNSYFYVEYSTPKESSPSAKEEYKKATGLPNVYMPKLTKLEFSLDEKNNTIIVQNLKIKNQSNLYSVTSQLNRYAEKQGLTGHWAIKQNKQSTYNFKFDKLSEQQKTLISDFSSQLDFEIGTCK